MALFAGGCAFADVEAVCADRGDASLDGLESLVDKALVQVEAQDRLQMLETIANTRENDSRPPASLTRSR